MTNMRRRTLVFVGSYAEASSSGIYVYELDTDTGSLILLDQALGLQNPSFQNLDASNLRLYSIAERLSEEGQRIGDAVSFSIDPARGKLQLLNRAATMDTTTCHIQRDIDNRFLVVASYSGGKVGLISLNEDGRIGELRDVKQHEGSSAHAELGRHDIPHPHSAFFSPDNRFVFIPDLGLDRIRAYRLDLDEGQLQFHNDTVLQPGAGPRHLVFHPNGNYAFVINELDSTIVSFRYDGAAGELRQLQMLTTLPSDYIGENACAEIQISPDGKFLYGSNRGHDSLAVFSISMQKGELAFVEHVSTQGQHPRHFSITPDGRFVVVANRDTDNIATFRVDRSNGKLQFTGYQAHASKPVCVQMAHFPV